MEIITSTSSNATVALNGHDGIKSCFFIDSANRTYRPSIKKMRRFDLSGRSSASRSNEEPPMQAWQAAYRHVLYNYRVSREGGRDISTTLL
ncbi:hypothetical protein [Burkholderia stagnalis]|uniref:hypothetical protein n=1 Tax=Burkholderia stagnalis TaxID=1503054 RepID=UPI000F5706DF|nr:hypothetical protein [Burkholderia stagnalis]